LEYRQIAEVLRSTA